MRLDSLFAAARRTCRHWRETAAAAPNRPLLDAQALADLAALARALPHRLFDAPARTAAPLIGETLSFARSRGLEFEESRSHEPGDEPRWLDWRLYARTGRLHTKVFSEEHRPQAFLLVDRRAGMRFGTRRQLKAALAAQIAVCGAHQARQTGLAVGALLLGEHPQWLAPAAGGDAFEGLLTALAAPCPPLPFDAQQPGLGALLRETSLRLPLGCAVLLVSDFIDLDPDTAPEVLRQLAAAHRVRAFQVLDPVEEQLPAQGRFWIEDPAAEQPLDVDADSRRVEYAEGFRAAQARLADCFADSGIPLHTCRTTDDVRHCLEQVHAASDRA